MGAIRKREYKLDSCANTLCGIQEPWKDSESKEEENIVKAIEGTLRVQLLIGKEKKNFTQHKDEGLYNSLV